MNKEAIAESFKQLQHEICVGLEKMDARRTDGQGGTTFRSDLWDRAEGGGGRTNTIANGNIIEKGGVAFSEVYGSITPEMKKQLNIHSGKQFYATGISIVLHPENPHIPIIHMNVRYFQLDESIYWFGGGIDLTPHYIVPENARLFHRQLKKICDRFDSSFYPEFKTKADDYFFLPHREETRGIGGIFYDHLSHENSPLNKQQLHDFAAQLASNFVAIYSEQVALGKDKKASEKEIIWRNIRRGRYVEFNLVHDRGTKFGLNSGGRTESILMSLPPLAQWEYDFQVEENSPEADTLKQLKKGISW